MDSMSSSTERVMIGCATSIVRGTDLPYENLVPDLAASSQLFHTTCQSNPY